MYRCGQQGGKSTHGLASPAGGVQLHPAGRWRRRSTLADASVEHRDGCSLLAAGLFVCPTCAVVALAAQCLAIKPRQCSCGCRSPCCLRACAGAGPSHLPQAHSRWQPAGEATSCCLVQQGSKSVAGAGCAGQLGGWRLLWSRQVLHLSCACAAAAAALNRAVGCQAELLRPTALASLGAKLCP